MTKATRNISFIHAPNNYKYSIIIPAAGQGLRMKSCGVKSLISLTSQINVIQNQLNIIQNKFRSYEVILVTGFQSERLMKNTPNDIVKIENEHYEDTNVCRSIGIGLKAATTNKVIIIYGDLVFNKQALDVKFNKGSTLIIDSSNTMTDNEVGCTIDNGKIEQVLYDLPNKWAQIAYFTNTELELLKKLAYDRNNDKLYGFELINEIINNGGEFTSIQPDGIRANDIDIPTDITIAQQII